MVSNIQIKRVNAFYYVQWNYRPGALKMRSIKCKIYCLHVWLIIFNIFFSSFWTVDRVSTFSLLTDNIQQELEWTYLILYFLLWFYQNVLWNWYHQYARVFDWKQICYLCWTCFSRDIRHTYGYKRYFTSRRRVPLFVWGRLHTGVLDKDEQKLARSFFHVPLYRPWCPFT